MGAYGWRGGGLEPSGCNGVVLPKVEAPEHPRHPPSLGDTVDSLTKMQFVIPILFPDSLFLSVVGRKKDLATNNVVFHSSKSFLTS